MDTKKVAVVGAGVMGSDIALDLATFKHEIILNDISQDALEKAKDKILTNLRVYSMMRRDLAEHDGDDILSRISFQTGYDGFDSLDIVIENVTEDYDIKEEVYTRLRDVCTDNTIFGVNTSCVSITKIAALMPCPENVIGAHFMNPVPINEMVEVIRGFHTSEETETAFVDFLKSINKSPVVVNDLPGFVANRLSHLFMNEAAFLVQDQVASPEEIDMIFQKGYGHKMGPLQTADLIGLDTVVKSLEVLYKNYEDPKFRCCPLLRKMVDAGYLGKKSGKGFFEYAAF